MRSSKKLRMVLVTAPDMKVARKLAKAALKKRLAACANLVPALESHYWWQGKMESAKEVLILFKTTKQQLPELEALVLKEHPYETPEFVAVNPVGATKKYFEWWLESIGS